MDMPIARTASTLALAAGLLLLSACGNKGPLTMVSEPPPVAPMDADAAPADATLPDTTPPEQPPATDVVVPPPSDSIDETQPPPATDDGDSGD